MTRFNVRPLRSTTRVKRVSNYRKAAPLPRFQVVRLGVNFSGQLPLNNNCTTELTSTSRQENTKLQDLPSGKLQLKKHNVAMISVSREEKTMSCYHAAAPPVDVLLLATCAANKTADEGAARPPSGSRLRSKQLFFAALCHSPPITN